MAGRQPPFMTILVLFWINGDHGRLARREETLACRAGWLVRRGAVPHRHHIGPELPDITSAIVSLMPSPVPQVWQQAHLPFDTSDGKANYRTLAQPSPWPQAQPPLTAGAILKAWSPFIIPGPPWSRVEPQALQGVVRRRRPAGLDHHQHPCPILDKLVAKDAPGGRTGHAFTARSTPSTGWPPPANGRPDRRHP